MLQRVHVSHASSFARLGKGTKMCHLLDFDIYEINRFVIITLIINMNEET